MTTRARRAASTTTLTRPRPTTDEGSCLELASELKTDKGSREQHDTCAPPLVQCRPNRCSAESPSQWRLAAHAVRCWGGSCPAHRAACLLPSTCVSLQRRSGGKWPRGGPCSQYCRVPFATAALENRDIDTADLALGTDEPCDTADAPDKTLALREWVWTARFLAAQPAQEVGRKFLIALVCMCVRAVQARASCSLLAAVAAATPHLPRCMLKIFRALAACASWSGFVFNQRHHICSRRSQFRVADACGLRPAPRSPAPCCTALRQRSE